MKKRIINKIIYIFFTLCLIVLFILFTLLIYEKIYATTDEARWNRENEKINSMNRQKLQNSTWESENFIWLYKGEKIPPKTEKKRILIVGDSYVWGDGYSNANYIWWQQLRNKFLENGYNDVEFVVMGMPGFNTSQQYEMLKKSDIKNSIDPDLILFAYVDNDTEAWQNPYDDNPVWVKAKASYKALENILPSKLNSFIKKLYPNLYVKVNNMLVEKYSSLYGKIGIKYIDYEKVIHRNLFLEEYSKNILIPLKNYLENELNIDYLFIEMPFFPSELAKEQIVLVKEKFDKLNMPFFELSSDYTLEVPFYDKNLYQITPSNAHPGTKTTEYIARKVFQILQNNYSNILGNKTKINNNNIIINDCMPRTINLKKINDNEFAFVYPNSKEKDSFLNMPFYENYIKLNFLYPINIKTIEITSDDNNIDNINLYINKINLELGYDDNLIHKVKYSEKYIWNINSKKVTSINIHADIKNGSSSNINMKIVMD